MYRGWPHQIDYAHLPWCRSGGTTNRGRRVSSTCSALCGLALAVRGGTHLLFAQCQFVANFST